MYESLLRLPYFQGMSKNDITSILDRVAFDFVKYCNGDVICKHGNKCNSILILVQGRMHCVAESPHEEYTLIEEINAPYAIEPHSMFGYSACYNRDYTADGHCTILAIEKKFLFSELTRHDIFTINFLNLISSRSQKQENLIWEQTPSSIAGRIYRFISSRCELQHGRKRVSIKMETLAAILCETRLNISKCLNEMQNSGIVELHRKEIIIPSLDKLAEYIKE